MSQATTVQKKGKYHHGDLRQQLVKALAELIEEKGPAGFSISEACRRAGVSTAAPYRHFEDRDDMLRAVALDGKHRMADAFRAALGQHPPGSSEVIAALGQCYISYAAANPEVFRLMFGLPDSSVEGTELRESGEAIFALVKEQIGLFLGLPTDNEAVERVAFPLWTFVHGLSHLKIDGMMNACPPDITEADLITFVGDRLLGPPTAGHTG